MESRLRDCSQLKINLAEVTAINKQDYGSNNYSKIGLILELFQTRYLFHHVQSDFIALSDSQSVDRS